ncbi:MAG TPA: DUF2272 domain-containing protein [Bauldia sp.]|nr:DUF2272 domain-containing protein [Bauldia sp.]
MADMIVNVESLNFRSAPENAPDTLKGQVFLGQRLTHVEDAGVEGWVSCRATIEDAEDAGFVKAEFLRKPISKPREALVASVHREWMRFRRGTGLEHVPPFSGFVGEMWQNIGIDLDGTDRDQPWSAAAISFMVKNAGNKYRKFKFASSHSKYIHHAIKAREADDRSVPFWGFRLSERKPRVGDLVCKDNPDFAPSVNFDVARELDAYRSHCDIIMKVDSERQRVLTIGGNVSHSVGITFYDLAPGDLLAPTNHVFALLANITDEE